MSSQKSKRKARRKRAVARRLRYIESQNPSLKQRPVMISAEVHPDVNKYRHILLGETCEYCKYWHINASPDGFGTCSCRDKFVYEGDGSRAPVDGLGYIDHEGHSAVFHTGKDFGCIHFEQWEDKL